MFSHQYYRRSRILIGDNCCPWYEVCPNYGRTAAVDFDLTVGGRVIVINRVTWTRPRDSNLYRGACQISAQHQQQASSRDIATVNVPSHHAQPAASRRPATARLPPVLSRYTTRTAIGLTIPTKQYHWCALLCDLGSSVDLRNGSTTLCAVE
jgi:hypothetical protein